MMLNLASLAVVMIFRVRVEDGESSAGRSFPLVFPLKKQSSRLTEQGLSLVVLVAGIFRGSEWEP